MPTYEYACRDCGERLEVVQSFKDDPLTVCPACEGRLRKVFSAAGIVFKGSGWHIKDYGTSRAPATDDKTDGKASEDKQPSDDKASDSAESKSTSSTEAAPKSSEGERKTA